MSSVLGRLFVREVWSARSSSHHWPTAHLHHDGDGGECRQQTDVQDCDLPDTCSRQQNPAEIMLDNGATYGVSQPIPIHFDEPIADRKAAEIALTVPTTPKVDRRLRRAVTDNGSEWSTVKLNLRRHCTYWQPEPPHELPRVAGWLVPHLQTVSVAVP